MKGDSPRFRAAYAYKALVGPCLLVIAMPILVLAAAADAHPRLGPILVVSAKVGGLLAERLAFIRADPTLRVLAEVGVLILLFDVGLEVDLRALARVGTSSVDVALIGVMVPIGLGWSAALGLLPESSMVVHLFVGAALSATSVGITARVLKDLGRLQSPEGQIILGTALLDDVLGLLVLAVVTGITAAAAGGGGLSSAALVGILLRALLFLGITVGLSHVLSNPIVRVAARTGHPEITLVLILCAFADKLACALGVLGGGISRLAVAIGMIPRGEVGLIFAGIGTTLTIASHPLLSPSLFSAVVLMVLVTTLVAPVGLRWAFQRSGV